MRGLAAGTLLEVVIKVDFSSVTAVAAAVPAGVVLFFAAVVEATLAVMISGSSLLASIAALAAAAPATMSALKSCSEIEKSRAERRREAMS